VIALLAAALLAATPHAPQREASEPLPPEQEARVQLLGKQLRCAVCQGLSIADSPSSMARAQLDTVRSLVKEGKTDQEIFDYFIARYGEWALLAPPAHGFNWIVWAGPALILVLGAFIISRLVRTGPEPSQASKEAAPPSGPPKQDAAEAEDPYLAAVRAELKK